MPEVCGFAQFRAAGVSTESRRMVTHAHAHRPGLYAGRRYGRDVADRRPAGFEGEREDRVLWHARRAQRDRRPGDRIAWRLGGGTAHDPDLAPGAERAVQP